MKTVMTNILPSLTYLSCFIKWKSTLFAHKFGETKANSFFSKSLVFCTTTLTPSFNPRFLDTCNRNVQRKRNASVYQDVWLHYNDNSLQISNTLFWMTSKV